MTSISSSDVKVLGPHRFPAHCSSLESISALVGQAARAASLDDEATYAIQLAVEEACDNIIEHAYGPDGHGDIECEFEIAKNELVVILRDYGLPFDPIKIAPPDLTSPLEQREVGGLGLHFIRQLTDDFEFEFGAAGNSLRLFKRRSQSAKV